MYVKSHPVSKSHPVLVLYYCTVDYLAPQLSLVLTVVGTTSNPEYNIWRRERSKFFCCHALLL